MDATNLTLIIPEKPDAEREAVARAWEMQGGEVLRLGRFWNPPRLDRRAVRVYGNETFCRVLEQKLNIALCSPPDDLILSVPPEFLCRKIGVESLSDTLRLSFPLFIKSVIPKLIRSRVFASAEDLASECVGMNPAEPLFNSEIARFAAEARSFVLDRTVLDCSVYEGEADHSAARDFVTSLVAGLRLPRTLVIDVGLLSDGNWALIEFNAAWGSGLNGCGAVRVLPAIATASAPS